MLFCYLNYSILHSYYITYFQSENNERIIFKLTKNSQCHARYSKSKIKEIIYFKYRNKVILYNCFLSF